MEHQVESHRGLFLAGLGVGVALAVAIYGIYFDRLSEMQLINLSMLWILPAVFGLYGLLAEKLARNVNAGKAESISDGLVSLTKGYGISGLFLLILASPILIGGGRRPLVVAIVGALFWVVLLKFFFSAIFPML